MGGSGCSERGFTLIEVIVAIVIISSLAVVFTPLIVSSVQRIKWSGQRTVELYTARSEMERTLAKGNIGREQTVVITAPGYSRSVKGIVVEAGGFVSFLPLKD